MPPGPLRLIVGALLSAQSRRPGQSAEDVSSRLEGSVSGDPQRPLAGKIALVTGASRGIGYATALALARARAHVVAVARTVGGLEELDDAIKALGGSATLVPLDLKDYQGIDRLGLALHERFGRLDVLIGN